MLKYTGNPYIDVGLATILAFVNKRKPEQLTEADLERIAQYMAEKYTVKPLRSFLTVAFPNSGFTQPAYFGDPEKQHIYAERVLRSFRSDTPKTGDVDIFLGAPVPDIPFDVKGELTSGRAYRQHIPLLTGENIINFFPGGEAGMLISGEALIAIQAFPLGCAKSAGRMLAVHSDNPEITLHFAKTFLDENRRIVMLSEGSDKLPEAHLSLRTLVIETLLKAAKMQGDYRSDELPFSVTVYHISNSGQQPLLDIYYLPLQVTHFIRKMLSVEFRDAWEKIVHRAWEVPVEKKGPKQEAKVFEPRKNYLYEDLFQLPTNAKRFLRTYFLREALNLAKMDPGDPRQTYSIQSEVQLVSWKLTQEFLRSILNMEEERITQIRNMGDRLAEYVSRQNDKRFFQEFYRENKYEFFRNRLMKANLAHVKRGNPPFIEFDPYIQVFEEGSELARPDWKLARDLVLIRMVEQLHTRGWFGQNPDAIAVINEVEENDQENQ